MLERFGKSISDCGNSITWGQYGALIESLVSDPTTRLAAELGEWRCRFSLEWLLAASLGAAVGSDAQIRWPWVKDETPAASVTDEDRAEAEARLKERWG